jgi:peptidoglycan/xylan/chitin deacetylase (PgdA/CDA1 family)
MSANSSTPSHDGERQSGNDEDAILLHGLGRSPNRRLAAAIGDGLPSMGRFRALVGSFDRVIGDLSGPDEIIRAAGQGLPAGAARAEAVAVRLRRRDVDVEWGPSRSVASVAELLRFCHARGESSIELARTDPTLVTELQVGSWFDADWRLRLMRRVALRLPWTLVRVALSRTGAGISVAADLSFWRGARTAASGAEWRRLTASSYVALVYHRLAGESKPGQETIDLAPERFDRQLGALRRLGFRSLQPRAVLAFHESPATVLPRRSYVVTFDDGTVDCLEPLLRHAESGAQLFVATRELGGRAHWLANEPLITWEEARALAAAGTHIGSHAQHHRRLTGRDLVDLVDELSGSLSDLRARLGAPIDVVAYPHGAHDLDVRRASQASGFRAGYTTAKGRNGAGTDVYCLRRVSIHGADGTLAVLWKVLTGEGLPHAWLGLRSRRRQLFGGARRSGRTRAQAPESD